MTNYINQPFFIETIGTYSYIFKLFRKSVTFKLKFNTWIPLALILHLQLNYFAVAYHVKSLMLPSVFYVTTW